MGQANIGASQTTEAAPPQTEAATAAESTPVVLAQNTLSAQDAVSDVANTTLGEVLPEREKEDVAALVIAPAAAGISGSTAAMVGVGGLALAGGGGGGGGGGGSDAPPSRFNISEVKLSADTGTKNDDRVTNVKLQTISGKISPSLAGDRLAVSVDGGSTWSDAVVTNDSWTALVNLKNEGNTAIQIRTTDASGKASIAITPITVTLDTTGPTTTVKTLTLSDDTGVSNTDFITKTESQTIKGTLTAALASDETVWVSVDDGQTWKQATVNKTDWSLSGAKLLGDKPHNIQVKITDLAGNDSKVTTQAYTLDTTAPTSAVQSLALLNDNDFSVAQVNQTVTGKLSASLSEGEKVIVSVDNGVTWKDATVASDGKSWLCEVELKYGTGTLKAAVTDAAGNTSSASPGSAAIQKYTVTTPLLTPLYDAITNPIAPSFKGLVITGEAAGYYSGLISNAGDVNGDGLDDLIIGTPPFTTDTENRDAKDPLNLPNKGRNYVVFGKEGTSAISLADIAAGKGGGFIIDGQNANDYSGSAVSNLGDINGDGLDDLLIGAPKSGPASGAKAGRAYVVFGKADTSAVSLADVAVGKGGFVINGQIAGEQSGFSVSGAGDVNGDGILDMVVGAPFGAVNGVLFAGRTYVVFGKTDNTPVDLFKVAAGEGGFVINSSVEGDWSGHSVSSLGDVNGDGLADLFIGVPFGDVSSTNNEGRGYVVFGKKETSAINLADVAKGTGGFVVNGVNANDHAGHSVSSAGDVNGDGLADLIIGAPFGDTTRNPGHAYVVFGKKDTSAINLAEVAAGKGGFVIKGEKPGENTGLTVSSAGDINGDGLADLLVGAIDVEANGKISSGRTYVVFGKTDNNAINLSEVAAGLGGFAVDGADAGGNLGRSVSSGDVNGDGLTDLILGASGDRSELTANSTSGSTIPAQIGRSFVIFGGQQTASVVDQMGTTGDDRLTGTSSSESFVGNQGNDTLMGNGGADVLYGGNGNDTFVLNTDNVAKLINGGVVDGHHARVDGGNGIDTLWLSGTGISLDLTKISNVGAGTPNGFSALNSIERIDLTNYGNGSSASNNTLRLSAQDVQDMAGMNIWKVPSANNTLYHQLMIDGDATDKVTVVSPILTDWVHQAELFTNNNVSYDVWINDATHTQLLVNHAVAVSVVV